jgi:hypothetical protein
MGVVIYGRNNQLLVPGREQGIVVEEDPSAVADGAAAKCRSRRSWLRSRQQTLDPVDPRDHQRSSHGLWRVLLAISQVAAAVQIEFKKVESAPMVRFHSIGQVFPDALYGHIIIMFDVAVLRGQIKDLQEGISYRRERATPKHRDLYDVLEENLLAGNQELEGDMTFFCDSSKKGENIRRVDCRRTRALERSSNPRSQ